MARPITITFRTTPELRDALKRIAEQEHRPIANLIEKILLDFVAERRPRDEPSSR